MKDKKNYLLLLLPVLVFVFSFYLIKFVNSSYAINSDTAPEVSVPLGQEYKMIAKNTYSWHAHKNNFNEREASGTKLIESTQEIDGQKHQAVVFCATQGDQIKKTSSRYRYPIDNQNVNLNDSKKEKLKAVMPYMYPYINLGVTSSDTNTLKAALKSSIGLDSGVYEQYEFDKLNVNEAIAASQGAIWTIQKNVGINYYRYSGTLSGMGFYDFSFSKCDDYYKWKDKDGTTKNKIITSEEQRWYNESQCSKDGNFYKYVFNHTKQANTANRINTLIKWYVSELQGKLGNSQTIPFFKITSNNFTYAEGAGSNGGTLELTYETNLNNYEITFKDDSNNILNATKTGNTYMIYPIESSIKSVSWSVKATGSSTSVYYYNCNDGQDFIGLEHGKYETSGTELIKREEKGNLVIYKINGESDGISIFIQDGLEFDQNKCTSNNQNICLNNAKFELYYKKDNTMKLVKRIVTNYSNTDSVVINDLPLGTYYLIETQAPYGYDLYQSGTIVDDYSYDPYRTIGADRYIEFELVASKTIGIEIKNVKNKICFKKIDGKNGNNALAHAKYQLEDIDGTVVEVFETSANVGQEVYCIEGQLQTGSYFIQEIEAPEGYSLDTNRYRFILGKSEYPIANLGDIGSYVPISPTNGVITFTDTKEVEISKSDATTGACVAGAELIIKDKNNTEIDRWISSCSCGSGSQTTSGSNQNYECANEDGIITEDEINNPNSYICGGEQVQKSCNSHHVSLPEGCYTLTENMTEELQRQGYSTGETVEFCVDEDGKVAEPVDMKDAPIKVCIYKVAKGSTDPLAGATFKLYDDEDNFIQTIKTTETPSNDCIIKLPIGKYYVREITAPDGYIPLEQEVEIDVIDTKNTQYFYIENEIDTPKTSMNGKSYTIIAIVFMIFGFLTVGYYVRKKVKVKS